MGELQFVNPYAPGPGKLPWRETLWNRSAVPNVPKDELDRTRFSLKGEYAPGPGDTVPPHVGRWALPITARGEHCAVQAEFGSYLAGPGEQARASGTDVPQITARGDLGWVRSSRGQ